MTLNKVLKQITDLVASHRLIKTLHIGGLTEWNSFTNLGYPACLVTLNDATVLERETSYNFSLFLIDLLNDDSNNKHDVQSDQIQVLQDLLSDFSDESIEWKVNKDGNSITFIDDERGNDNPDRVAGVRSDFTIKVDFVRDRCQIPKRKAIQTEQGFILFTEDDKAITLENN